MALYEHSPVNCSAEEKEAFALYMLLSNDDDALKQEHRFLTQKLTLLESLKTQLLKQAQQNKALQNPDQL